MGKKTTTFSVTNLSISTMTSDLKMDELRRVESSRKKTPNLDGFEKGNFFKNTRKMLKIHHPVWMFRRSRSLISCLKNSKKLLKIQWRFTLLFGRFWSFIWWLGWREAECSGSEGEDQHLCPKKSVSTPFWMSCHLYNESRSARFCHCQKCSPFC